MTEQSALPWRLQSLPASSSSIYSYHICVYHLSYHCATPLFCTAVNKNIIIYVPVHSSPLSHFFIAHGQDLTVSELYASYVEPSLHWMNTTTNKQWISLNAFHIPSGQQNGLPDFTKILKMKNGKRFCCSKIMQMTIIVDSHSNILNRKFPYPAVTPGRLSPCSTSTVHQITTNSE